jgi:hypothetical protein
MDPETKPKTAEEQKPAPPARPAAGPAAGPAQPLHDALNSLIGKVSAASPGIDWSNEVDQIRYGIGRLAPDTVDGPANTIVTALALLEAKATKHAPGAKIDAELNTIRSIVAKTKATASAAK